MWAASKAAVIGYVHLKNEWGKGSSRWERKKHRGKKKKVTERGRGKRGKKKRAGKAKRATNLKKKKRKAKE